MRRELLIGLALAALVWFTRSYDADRFVTADEPAWAYRSARFAAAVAEGDWRGTALSGHPGVTTMWIGGLSLLAQETLGDGTLREPLAVAQALPGYDATDAEALRALTDILPQAKAGMAIAHALIALAIWLLLVRLLELRYAVAAAGLLLLDPYYMGQSRVLHLDALMSGLMLAALLAALVYRRDGQRRWLIAAGAATGLAILTKTAALILVPCLGALLGLPHILPAKDGRPQHPQWRQAVATLAPWGLTAAAVIWALWPAAWVAPWATARQMLSLSQGYMTSAEETTRYFLGRVVQDTGALFYPVVLVLRSTPLTLVGLAAALAELWRTRGAKDAPLAQRRTALWWLLATALAYLAVITLSGKKYDRYALPALLALDVAAAVGLLGLAERKLARLGQWASRGLLAAIALQAAALLAPLWPAYALAYYNPLVGGRATAAWALEMGWGEGLEQAVAYLSALPHADEGHLATRTVIGATRYPGQVSYLTERTTAAAEYVLLYHTDKQLQEPPAAPFLSQEPLFVAQIAGHPYAWVYANPLNVALRQQVAAWHADGQAIVANGPVHLEPVQAERLRIIEANDWESAAAAVTEAAQGARELLYIQLHGGQGDTEDPLAEVLHYGAVLMERRDEAGYSLLRYALAPAPRFGRAQARAVTYADFDALILERYGVTRTRIEEGMALGVALLWRAPAAPQAAYHVSLRLDDERGYTWGQSDALLRDGQGRAVAEWEGNSYYASHHSVTLAAGTPPGRYCLTVSVYRPDDLGALAVWDAAGRLLGTAHALGCIEVAPPSVPLAPERLDVARPLHWTPGDGIALLGVGALAEAESGQRVPVWLCWGCEAAPQERYWAELALVRDKQVAGSARDHPLGSGHPTERWQPGESACYPLELEIAPEAPSGRYALMLTLARAADGAPLAEPLRLGEMEVTHRERRFAPPEPMHEVDARFGEQIALRGYDLAPARPAAGQPLQVTLYWQALQRPEGDYTVFVHLLDEQGTIVDQRDAQPQEGTYPTGEWAAGEVVADRHTLSVPEEASGSLRLAIGLYDARTGQRLALYDAEGTRAPGDALQTQAMWVEE